MKSKIIDLFDYVVNISDSNGKTVNIGNWLAFQKQGLMKKYQGQTIEEIRNNPDISEEDKKRMMQLLQLGVAYAELRTQTPEEIWQENFDVLVEYINSSE